MGSASARSMAVLSSWVMALRARAAAVEATAPLRNDSLKAKLAGAPSRTPVLVRVSRGRYIHGSPAIQE